jgi:glycosyltransferase involved in cell wall biosynthesis
MNVLHIINNLDIGGGAQTLVKDLSVKGSYNHKIITLEKSPDAFKNLQFIRFLEQPIKSLKLIYNADVIHLHLFPTLYLSPLLFFKKKVFTEHNTHNRRRNYLIFKYIDTFFYIFYRKIICISDGTKISLKKWILKKSFNLEVIYNGVDFASFENSKIHFNLSKEKYYQNEQLNIGMVGSFSNQKNQLFLIELIKDLPENFTLHLAGIGPNLNHCKQYVEEKKLDERVFFYGLIKDIPRFYSTLDLYIHSAHWEGFGLTVIEAIASKLPVLASNVEGLKEIINSEMLFKNYDKEGLKQLIFETFNVKTEESINKTYNDSKRLFDINLMVKKYESAYKNL